MDFKFSKSNLNFRVYTSESEPTTPGIENDIVIITSVPMTNWILSPDKPSGAPRTDGDVCIQYSAEGNTFNALKNNSMRIATISAYQFIDGSWVDVTAKSYQNGKWVDWWNGELYTPGNEYESITGGWVCKENCGSKYAGPSVLTKEETGLKVYTAPNYGGLVRCSNKIDVTNYDTLSVTATASINLFVLSDLTLGEWNPANITANTVLSGSGTKTLDISALTGEFYIAIGHAVAYNASAVTFYITEVKMA